MTWSKYEIFSVLSGFVLIGAAFMPGMSVKDRMRMGAAGVLFAGYGFFVAAQTSGTWEFPWMIFVIPFIGLGYAGVRAYEWWTKETREESRR
ncbi:hypothetical protein ACQPZP_33525 [Spirillospora sp. CA-142024]|uniref:hypothetical protein n=1 Tax=Spirillospora sp. CA-142024 TaxID=3240036 RepID=UPI003D8CF77F